MFGQGHEPSASVCMCTTGQFIQTAMPKVPCAERKHIYFLRLSGSPWSKTNTEASFSISTSLSTSGAYETGFIAEPYTKGHICMNYAQHGRSNPQTVLIISSMWNIARSKQTRCNQMVFPSRVFVEICLPKGTREDAAPICIGLACVHFWLRGQGANGGRERERERERERGEEHEGEWDGEGCCEPFCWNVQRWREAICCITTTCRRERGEGGSVAPQVMISPRLDWNKCTRYSATVTSICY